MSVYELSNVLSAFADALAYFIMFEAFLQRRLNFRPSFYFLGICTLTVLILLCNHFLIFSFFNVLGMPFLAVFVSLLYNGKIRNRLIAVALSVLIGFSTEVIILSMMTYILNETSETIVQILDYRLFGIFSSKLLELVICNVIRVRRKRIKFNLDYWLIFLLLFFCYIAITYIMFDLSYALNATTYNEQVVTCSFFLFLGIIFSLFLYERQIMQSKAIHEKEQYEQHLKLQLKHLDDLLAKQNELRKFKHDIVNQLEGLRGYLQVGDVVGGLNHLEGLTDHLAVITPAFNTGNVALDATLSAKKTLAESQGICFSARLNVEENLPIAPEDICTIFGNALDNAIEACLLLDDEQQKSIALSLVQIDAVLLCKIINTALQQPRNNLTTSKKDKVNHGFGIVNLTESLAKYGSVPAIEWQEGSFSLSFILPLKDES